MDGDLRRWLRDKVRSARERGPLLSAYMCVICGFVLGTNGSHQCSFAARPDHPQMDADLRRWLRDKVRSARERTAAFICVYLRHLRIRSLGTKASHQSSFAARLIIHRWTQVY